MVDRKGSASTTARGVDIGVSVSVKGWEGMSER